MPDREKVIKAWETVLSRDPLDVAWDLIDDTITLLKGQEPVRPYLDFDGKDVWTCGNCNRHLFHLSHTQCDDDEEAFHKYCGYCGRAVKWYA